MSLPRHSPRSMRLARATSWSAESSGTRPISRKYIRTGSSMPTPSMSSTISTCSSAGSTSSNPWSGTSSPIPGNPGIPGYGAESIR